MRINLANETIAVSFRGNLNLNFIDLFKNKSESFCGYFDSVSELELYENSEGYELIDGYYAYIPILRATYKFLFGNTDTHNGTTVIKPTSIDAEDPGRWILYNTSESGGDTVTLEDIRVLGVNQGMYKDGDTIPAGTSFETILKNMLQVFTNPVYYSPLLSLASVGASFAEVGETINISLNPTFTENDAGVSSNYLLKQNGSVILSNTNPVNHSVTIDLTDDEVTFQSQLSYLEGIIKNDSNGDPYPTEHITAGSINSNIIKVQGKRNLFYVSDEVRTAPETSEDIRSMNSILNPVKGTVFQINIPIDANRIVFSYPDSLGEVTSVKYIELGNAEVKDTFDATIIQVNGANDSLLKDYRTYTYIPAIPFGGEATYLVTI